MSDLDDVQIPQPAPIDFTKLKDDICGKIQEFDESVRQYHLSIQDPGLDYYRQSIQLLGEMIQGIAEPLPGWHPKFATNSIVNYVVALSASGSLRSLLATYKLLIDGYFLEAHAAMRMVVEWAELAVIVEAEPNLANQLLGKGVKEKHREIASQKSPDVDKLLKAMTKTFSQLSQRGHITKTAIQLIVPSLSDNLMALSIAGNASDETLSKDGLALAQMVLNAIRIIRRHFRMVPSHWQSRFIQIEQVTQKRRKLISKENH